MWKSNSLSDGLIVMKCIWSGASRFPLDDRHLHVLDLDADKQKVDLPNDHVLQMVSEIDNVMQLAIII